MGPDPAPGMAMAEEFVKRMMSDMRFRTFCVLAVAVVGMASRSAAGTIVTVPPSLAPGSQYRLVFVTDDFYTATSANINDYNTDVNNEANSVFALAALGTTWLDIGSTFAVNAIFNIGIDAGVPIYDLEGNLVAIDAGNEAGGLFTLAILSPITYSEGGAVLATHVWTGTLPIGDAAPYTLGGVGGLTDTGFSADVNAAWVYAGLQLSALEGMPPHLDELDEIYLWGMQVYGKRPSAFIGVTAGFGTDGDREGWMAFLDAAKKLFDDFGDIPFVHWHHYEKTHIKQYIERYGDPDGIAARVLTNLLDLLPITKNAIAIPRPSYSLKVVEEYVGFKRTQDEYGGSWAMAQFILATETEDEGERNLRMADILKYNEEDLAATWAVFEWLRDQRPCPVILAF